jgi:carboxymethylenebutenolidase
VYDAMLAESVRISGAGGDPVEAYLARPLSGGPFGGVVVIHHMPGYDQSTKEMVRRFAVNGYNALCPNLYSREAPGATPDDAAAAARAKGGVADDQVVGDIEGAARYLRGLTSSNGKVGTIGYCSGGRHSFLAAVSLPLDAAVDCYGAFIVEPPPAALEVKMGPLVDRAPDLSCPMLGLFGADDTYPGVEQVGVLEEALKKAGKTYDFKIYEGAGHAFFNVDRPSYRAEAANDGWERIWDFFGRYLSS